MAARGGPQVITCLTYNTLFPQYALKWNEPEGCRDGQDTWEQRLPTLRHILEASWCDVVFLQEVGPAQVRDLHTGSLAEWYVPIFAAHPGRRDGLAIWYKKNRFRCIFEGRFTHSNGHVSLFAKLVLTEAGAPPRSLLAGCVHIEWKKAEGFAQMEELLAFLAHDMAPQDAIIIGGDFNRVTEELRPMPARGFSQTWIYGEPTRHADKIDHIFFRGGRASLTEVQHRWVDKAAQAASTICVTTGLTPSDHRPAVAAFAVE